MPYTLEQLKTPGLTIHAKKVSMMITEKIRGHGTPYDIPFVAYLFYKLLNSKDNKLNSSFSLEETAEKQLERFRTGEIPLNPYVLNSITHSVRRSFIRSYKVYEDVGATDEIYAALVVLFDDYLNVGRSTAETTTSNSLIRLTQAILDIQDDDKVADICCGNGNFITRSIDIKPRAKYFGYERDIRCAAILAMKADILGVNPSVVMGDIEYTLSDKNIKFDKIFSNYPLNLVLDHYEQISHTLPFRIGRTCGDWYFNNVVMDHLADTGRAVTIAGVGTTWNAMSKEARQYFIENGYIEAVISLPGGLVPGTAVPLTAYVFSHGNKHIRLINAEDIITVKYRYNKFLSDENIMEILELLHSDSDNSIRISKDEARNKDYSLAFKSYRSGLPKYKNGTTLSEVADIIRGTLNPRNDATDKNTGKYLLQISDLENGQIKTDLGEDRFIDTEKDHREQKLLPYDLVITRSAQPVKVAIVSPNERRELYPNGNMFIIRVKGTTVNPYYLLSFLMSEDGQDALDYASTGNTLKTISASSLSELEFPLKEPSEQRKVSEIVIESMAQYKAYTYKADLAKSRIKNAYYYNEEV